MCKRLGRQRIYAAAHEVFKLITAIGETLKDECCIYLNLKMTSTDWFPCTLISDLLSNGLDINCGYKQTEYGIKYGFLSLVFFCTFGRISMN